MPGHGGWEDRQLVFVGGLHRSGTTYVAELLQDSPLTASLRHTGVPKDEGQFLQDVYPTDQEMGGSTRWTRDPRFHLTERDADRVPDAAQRLWGSWEPHVAGDGRFVVEKTPANLTRTRFLQRVFANSSFVIVTRHPLTQALAIGKWSASYRGKLGLDVPALVRQWVRAHEALEADSVALARLLVVRFEDLVRDPAGEQRRIFGFLGLPAVDGPAVTLDAVRAGAYASRWTAATSRGAVPRNGAALVRSLRADRSTGLAARGLGDSVVYPVFRRRLLRSYGARIARLGYDLDVLDSAAPW